VFSDQRDAIHNQNQTKRGIDTGSRHAFMPFSLIMKHHILKKNFTFDPPERVDTYISTFIQNMCQTRSGLRNMQRNGCTKISLMI